jgi:hypothetical protein
LEALHIAYRGEFPIFMYGQNYMGTLEAYFGAIFYHLFGVSLLSLRLGMLTLFSLFLFALSSLTKTLYSPKMALLTLVVLSVGAEGVLIPEIMVLGGTTETLLFGTLLLLLATHLALTSGRNLLGSVSWRRFVGFAAWGCCVGLGLWSHLLVAPFVLTSALLLLLFCRCERRTLALLAIFLGFLIGGFPLIIYNVTAPLSQNSLATFLNIYNIGNSLEHNPDFVLRQLSGTFLSALPVATGVNALCNVTRLPFFAPPPFPMTCIVVQGTWSIGYLALLVTSLGLSSWGLFKLKKAQAGRLSQWPIKDMEANV